MRDLDTHEPCRGVEVGDIGQKIGYNAVDNGYLLLTKKRVPRRALLCRFTEITPDGEFDLKADPRILYTIMSKVRMMLIAQTGTNILKAGKTAVRYAVCRR